MSINRNVEPPVAWTPGTDLPAPDAGIRGRLKTGSWGLLDQGVVSFGNFFTNILLARHLSPALYGIYGLIFGILAFFNTLHGSLIAYPLSVEGSSGRSDFNSQLTWISLIFTTFLALPWAMAIGAAAWATGLLRLAPWIICALVLWQIQETLRRALMADERYRDTLYGDAVSYLGQAGGVWYLTATGTASLERIFLVMAATSLLGAIIQLVQISIRFVSPASLLPLAKKYWELGRWLILSNLVSLVNLQAVPWVLAASHGLGETAKLLAMGNLLGVTHPALFGVNNLVVPAVARANDSRNKRSTTRIAVEYGAGSALRHALLPGTGGVAFLGAQGFLPPNIAVSPTGQPIANFRCRLCADVRLDGPQRITKRPEAQSLDIFGPACQRHHYLDNYFAPCKLGWGQMGTGWRLGINSGWNRRGSNFAPLRT